MNRSAQREAILQELARRKDHPTAQDIHEALKSKMPHLSLGTVYRNLEQLANAGIILELSVAGRQKRFDYDTSEHHHIRCPACGRVADLGKEESKLISRGMKDIIEQLPYGGFYLEFQHKCSDCMATA